MRKKKRLEIKREGEIADLIAVLEDVRDKQDLVAKHFFWGRNVFWKAFQQYLEDHALLLLDPPRYSDGGRKCDRLIGSSAHGPIYFKKIRAGFRGDNTVRLELYADWYNEEDDNGATLHPSIREDYWFAVPYDLIRSFTQKKFNVWIAGLKREFKKSQEKEARERLAILKKEFPSLNL